MHKTLQTLAFLCLLLGTASASLAQERATLAPRPSGLSDDFPACYSIDARKGWQRVPVLFQTNTAFLVLSLKSGPRSLLEAMNTPYQWSVDDNRFQRVGPDGHVGADGDALEPFAGFKYDRSLPFGALLVRGVDLSPRHMRDLRGSVGFDDGHRWLEFRINDTAFGDNGGALIVCSGTQVR